MIHSYMVFNDDTFDNWLNEKYLTQCQEYAKIILDENYLIIDDQDFTEDFLKVIVPSIVQNILNWSDGNDHHFLDHRGNIMSLLRNAILPLIVSVFLNMDPLYEIDEENLIDLLIQVADSDKPVYKAFGLTRNENPSECFQYKQLIEDMVQHEFLAIILSKIESNPKGVTDKIYFSSFFKLYESLSAFLTDDLKKVYATNLCEYITRLKNLKIDSDRLDGVIILFDNALSIFSDKNNIITRISDSIIEFVQYLLERHTKQHSLLAAEIMNLIYKKIGQKATNLLCLKSFFLKDDIPPEFMIKIKSILSFLIANFTIDDKRFLYCFIKKNQLNELNSFMDKEYFSDSEITQMKSEIRDNNENSENMIDSNHNSIPLALLGEMNGDDFSAILNNAKKSSDKMIELFNFLNDILEKDEFNSRLNKEAQNILESFISEENIDLEQISSYNYFIVNYLEYQNKNGVNFSQNQKEKLIDLYLKGNNILAHQASNLLLEIFRKSETEINVKLLIKLFKKSQDRKIQFRVIKLIKDYCQNSDDKFQMKFISHKKQNKIIIDSILTNIPDQYETIEMNINFPDEKSKKISAKVGSLFQVLYVICSPYFPDPSVKYKFKSLSPIKLTQTKISKDFKERDLLIVEKIKHKNLLTSSELFQKNNFTQNLLALLSDENSSSLHNLCCDLLNYLPSDLSLQSLTCDLMNYYKKIDFDNIFLTKYMLQILIWKTTNEFYKDENTKFLLKIIKKIINLQNPTYYPELILLITLFIPSQNQYFKNYKNEIIKIASYMLNSFELSTSLKKLAVYLLKQLEFNDYSELSDLLNLNQILLNTDQETRNELKHWIYNLENICKNNQETCNLIKTIFNLYCFEQTNNYNKKHKRDILDFIKKNFQMLKNEVVGTFLIENILEFYLSESEDILRPDIIKITEFYYKASDSLKPKLDKIIDRFINRLLTYYREKDHSYHLERNKVNIRGLKNLGSTCYMNSSLQQFYMIPKVKRHIINDFGPDHELFFELKTLFCRLELSRKKFCNPHQFFKTFCSKHKIIQTQQQDAEEFIHFFIDDLPQNIQKMFKGKIIHRILNEEEIVVNEEEMPFTTLQLPIANEDIHSLNDSICNYFSNEYLDKENKYSIEDNQKINAISSLLIKKLPKILIIQLIRFNKEGFKINKKIKINKTICFKEYAINSSKIDSNYNLHGAIVHEGTTNSGHYISLIKSNNFGWLKFNDKNVEIIDEKQFKEDASGSSDNRKNAYILFFLRNDINNVMNADNSNTYKISDEIKNPIIAKNNKIMKNSFDITPKMIKFILTHSTITKCLEYFFIDNSVLLKEHAQTILEFIQAKLTEESNLYEMKKYMISNFTKIFQPSRVQQNSHIVDLLKLLLDNLVTDQSDVIEILSLFVDNVSILVSNQKLVSYIFSLLLENLNDHNTILETAIKKNWLLSLLDFLYFVIDKERDFDKRFSDLFQILQNLTNYEILKEHQNYSFEKEKEAISKVIYKAKEKKARNSSWENLKALMIFYLNNNIISESEFKKIFSEQDLQKAYIQQKFQNINPDDFNSNDAQDILNRIKKIETKIIFDLFDSLCENEKQIFFKLLSSDLSFLAQILLSDLNNYVLKPYITNLDTAQKDKLFSFILENNPESPNPQYFKYLNKFLKDFKISQNISIGWLSQNDLIANHIKSYQFIIPLQCHFHQFYCIKQIEAMLDRSKEKNCNDILDIVVYIIKEKLADLQSIINILTLSNWRAFFDNSNDSISPKKLINLIKEVIKIIDNDDQNNENIYNSLSIFLTFITKQLKNFDCDFLLQLAHLSSNSFLDYFQNSSQNGFLLKFLSSFTKKYKSKTTIDEGLSKYIDAVLYLVEHDSLHLYLNQKKKISINGIIRVLKHSNNIKLSSSLLNLTKELTTNNQYYLDLIDRIPNESTFWNFLLKLQIFPDKYNINSQQLSKFKDIKYDLLIEVLNKLSIKIDIKIMLSSRFNLQEDKDYISSLIRESLDEEIDSLLNEFQNIKDKNQKTQNILNRLDIFYLIQQAKPHFSDKIKELVNEIREREMPSSKKALFDQITNPS